MEQYPENSAQALWHLMSIMALADNNFHKAEVKEFDWTVAFVEKVFGKNLSEEKRQVVIDKTIDTWNAIGDGESILDYITQAAKKISNRKKQKFALGAIINVASSDDIFDDSEFAILNIVRREWGLSEDEMKTMMGEKHPSFKQIEELLGGITT